MSKPVLNQTAPDFQLDDLNHKPVKLSDLRGQKYVLLVLNRGFA